ncbi:MAG: response regulator [Terracidiphilus sp.]|jgi:DNA-binding response OmpR family regulator
MPRTESDPLPNSLLGLTTRFPIVPVKDIPASVFRVDTDPCRPMVLVVDDEAATADSLVELLNRSGYAAIAAYDGQDALENALLMPPELLIADVVLPGMSGIDLANALRSKIPECQILLYSGKAATSGLPASDTCLGQKFELLHKPLHPTDLLALVKESLKSQKAHPAASD